MMKSILLRGVVLVFVILSTWQPPQADAASRLAGNASPYLAMHAEDPVDWREWNAAALAEARRHGRLLLVSVGYFACHWCHVMQRESYRDAEVARLLNGQFIPVKVDKELNAGLDATLQAFSERTRGRAGWPLNVFVTPDGQPLFAMQYAPRDEFLRIAAALAERWRKDRAGLEAAARAASAPVSQPPMPADSRAAYLARAFEEADWLRGGFGAVAKFPQAPQLMALLELHAARPDAKLAELLRLTLDRMAGRGLQDHLSGGFFRYTVDPDWQQPHFEKMLYDNAQLALIYGRAARLLGDERHAAAARRTLDFLMARMERDGAFVASLSALDAAGVEGGSYLWPAGRIEALLDAEEWRAVRALWALDSAPPFEAGFLPAPQREASAAEAGLQQSAWAKLAKARTGSQAPRDEKIVAGWNGLLLAALAESAEKTHAVAAERLYRFIRSRLWTGQALHKGVSGGQVLPGAELEDYAYAAFGVWHYALARGDEEARRFALELQRAAWRRFHRQGVFHLEARRLLAAGADAWEDGYLPAPAPVLVGLGLQSGDAGLAAMASKALARARGMPSGDPFWRASLVAILARPGASADASRSGR
ncbi:MAG: thioredoxin domain-containing protein [Betaproteobacteria bacterium]|nr:thioredoxin domain-containing protein [Betaproteobacteria bacterium]